jgi:hypothetical protein
MPARWWTSTTTARTWACRCWPSLSTCIGPATTATGPGTASATAGATSARRRIRPGRPVRPGRCRQGRGRDKDRGQGRDKCRDKCQDKRRDRARGRRRTPVPAMREARPAMTVRGTGRVRRHRCGPAPVLEPDRARRRPHVPVPTCTCPRVPNRTLRRRLAKALRTARRPRPAIRADRRRKRGPRGRMAARAPAPAVPAWHRRSGRRRPHARRWRRRPRTRRRGPPPRRRSARRIRRPGPRPPATTTSMPITRKSDPGKPSGRVRAAWRARPGAGQGAGPRGPARKLSVEVNMPTRRSLAV